MTQYFLAYEAHKGSVVHKGYRVFIGNPQTPEELGVMLEEKLEFLREQYNAENIIATAFNRV